MRQPSVALLCAAIVAVVAPTVVCEAAGISSLDGWPRSPSAVAALVSLVLVFFAGVVVPCARDEKPFAVLECVLAAAPIAVGLGVTSAGPLAVPIPFLAAGVGLGLLACSLPFPWRGRLVAVTACALAGVPALAAAGVTSLRTDAALSSARPPLEPLATVDRTAGLARAGPADLVPHDMGPPLADRERRVGALARTPPRYSWQKGPPPWFASRWSPVLENAADAWPRSIVAARFVGSAAPPEDAISDLGIGAAATGTLYESDARDLDAFDLVVVGADAPDDPAAATVLANFARRGGLLVGPSTEHPWPPSLARRLGAAAVDAEGAGAARGFDAGHVARASDRAAFQSLIAAGLHRPRVSTVFHRATAVPVAALHGFAAPSDSSARSGPDLRAALIATALVGVVASFTRGRRRAGWIALLAAIGSGQIVLAAPPRGGPSAETAAIELGGPGARRLDVVRVSAGPSGWVASSDPSAEGDGLRVLGFEVVRSGGAWRLALGPDAVGWVIAERVATGALDRAKPADSPPEWALSMLDQPPARGAAGTVLVGTSPMGVRWPGVDVPNRVRTVVIRLRGG